VSDILFVLCCSCVINNKSLVLAHSLPTLRCDFEVLMLSLSRESHLNFAKRFAATSC